MVDERSAPPWRRRWHLAGARQRLAAEAEPDRIDRKFEFGLSLHLSNWRPRRETQVAKQRQLEDTEHMFGSQDLSGAVLPTKWGGVVLPTKWGGGAQRRRGLTGKLLQPFATSPLRREDYYF